MGACLSCALGTAPHKPGYGYGGDVIKQQFAREQLQQFDASKVVTAGEQQGRDPHGALEALQGGDKAADAGAGVGRSPPAPANAQPMNTRNYPNQNPVRAAPIPPPHQNHVRAAPMPPPQTRPAYPTQPPATPPPVYAPQAQRVPAVATFEMATQDSYPPTPPIARKPVGHKAPPRNIPGQPIAGSRGDPYSNPILAPPQGGFMNQNRASAALSIISQYDEGPANTAGGRGGMSVGNRGRGGMGPGPGNRGGMPQGNGGGGYRPDDRGRGGMPPGSSGRGGAPPNRGGPRTPKGGHGPLGVNGHGGYVGQSPPQQYHPQQQRSHGAPPPQQYPLQQQRSHGAPPPQKQYPSQQGGRPPRQQYPAQRQGYGALPYPQEEPQYPPQGYRGGPPQPQYPRQGQGYGAPPSRPRPGGR